MRFFDREFFARRFSSLASRLSPLALGVLLLAGCATRSSLDKTGAGPLQRFSYEQPQMGVPFRIILYAESEAVAEAAAGAAFDRIAELNSIMSDYETDSEVSKLSRSSETGSPEVPLSPDLWNVLERAQQLARQTEGAFDVTVGPCAALWRKARRERQLPDAARLETARNKVGYQNLLLNDSRRTARLTRFGMRLDLGGIAKGYAADEAIKVLRTRGITHALVAASGDLSLADPPPGQKGWKIELIGYDQPNGPGAITALLANCGVATSGDLSQRLEIGGTRYSHILNPFTCVGMTNHALATVVAKDCMTADSLATPTTILDPEAAFHLADRYKAAVRLVRIESNLPVPRHNRRFDRIKLVSEKLSQKY